MDTHSLLNLLLDGIRPYYKSLHLALHPSTTSNKPIHQPLTTSLSLSCCSQISTYPSYPPAQEVRAIAQTWAAALATSNFPLLMSLASPTATWWISGLEHHLPGLGLTSYHAREAMLRSLVGKMVNFKFEVESITVEEDQAIVEAHSSAGPWEGRMYKNRLLFKLVIGEQGKVESVGEWVDFGEVWRYINGNTVVMNPGEKEKGG
ncbi:hypothetical protein EDC01DRAFT_731432 [Geopyxis carbonaria]|nr:hypothetical protein EDC01DRAFT_731432 [Geopyxis carbonaria]